MAIAWASLVLLVLLLPGLLFHVAISFPEKFTREAVQRSPLGQVAASLFVAFFIHAILYLLLTWLCTGWLETSMPCIDLGRVLETITLETAEEANAASTVAQNLDEHRLAIPGYVALSSVLGVATGWLTGQQIVMGRLPMLAQHRWIYDLAIGEDDRTTIAYVLTHVRQEDRVLIYSGFLHSFALRPDGRFSYLVLTNAYRYYLHLESERPRTSDPEHWRRIGDPHAPGAPAYPDTHFARDNREVSLFVIEGEDVANAMFDRYRHHTEILITLADIIASVREEFFKELDADRPQEHDVSDVELEKRGGA